MIHVTFEKTQDFAPLAGEYKETDIDRMKQEVDFRIIDLGCIAWKDGRRQHVTKRELNKLCKQYTWATDF